MKAFFFPLHSKHGVRVFFFLESIRTELERKGWSLNECYNIMHSLSSG